MSAVDPAPPRSPKRVNAAHQAADKPSGLRGRFNPTRREKRFLVTLAAVGVCVAALWRPIQQRWLTWLVLRAEAPAQSLVDELVAQDSHPGVLLTQLWATDKIPHRLAILDYMQRHETPAHLLRAEEEAALLMDAARGGDLEAKETAFALLVLRRHPEVRGLALEQLRDLDPAVRVLGLRQLERVGDSQLIPLVIPSLNDPDPRVVATAGHALGRWTGNNFGFRLSLPLLDFNREPPDVDAAALSQGVARWMGWWETHQRDYPMPQGEPASSSPPWRLPTPDFSSEDLTGNEIRLSSFRGRTVLLSFWDKTATNAFSFLSDLSELQRRNSNRFVILGISLDSTVLERAHAHETGHEQAHGAKPVTHPDLDPIRPHLQKFVQDHAITYPVLLDAAGDVGRRFSAFVLPTNVLIDRAGNMCRRFIGVRSDAVVEAMLAEAEDSPRAARSVHP